MGRDFKYKITNRKNKPPQDCNDERYWNWDYGFEEIMSGNTVDGRNQWDGPCREDVPYTKQEMLGALGRYVDYSDGTEYEFRFTLRAFGHIISEMDDDDVVYIQYG